MKSVYDTAARKRAVNLTLNRDLVDQARKITGSLSSLVETLLAGHLAEEQRWQAIDAETVAATILTWRRFAETRGSFADEYSTL